MPTYTYDCSYRNCRSRFEVQQRITDESLTECPKCGNKTVKRVITPGTNFHLKGDNWFKTTGSY